MDMKNALSAAALAVLLAACSGPESNPNRVSVSLAPGADTAFYRTAQIAAVESAIMDSFGVAYVTPEKVDGCLSRIDLSIAAPRTDWSVATSDGRTTITVPSDYDPATKTCLETGAFPGLAYEATRSCLGVSVEAETAARTAYVAWAAGAACL